VPVCQAVEAGACTALSLGNIINEYFWCCCLYQPEWGKKFDPERFSF